MTVLLFERNLLWSVRLANALRALGHEALKLDAYPTDVPGVEGADLAIVNLTERDRVESIVTALKASGIPVVAHAGHGDKELMALGKRIGVDRLATNGQMANDLASVLTRATA